MSRWLGPNVGHKKITDKKPKETSNIKNDSFNIFLLVVSNYGGIPNISFLGTPEVGEREKEEQK